MGTFELARCVPAPQQDTFDVFSNFAKHGDFIPLTRMDCDPRPIGVDWRFTARSGVGPLSLVDRMEVSVWNPPHEFRIDKLGPLLDGWAHVHFTPEGRHTRVVWREHIMVRPPLIGTAVSQLSDPVNRAMFGRVLDGMARRAARGA